MNPSPFKEANKNLLPPADFDPAESKAAKEILSLPVWNDGEQCISLWQMTWRERFSALVFGRVWLRVLSGSTQPPVSLQAARTVFEEQHG